MSSVSHSILLAACLLLTACHGIRLESDFERNPDLEAQIIGQQQDAFEHIHLLELNDEIRDYLSHHIRPGASSAEKLNRLQELLFSPDYLNIQYHDAANHGAIETFNARQANCLSLVNLYIAMAREVGIDAHYHSVKIKPEWDLRGEVMVLSEHINATGKVSQDMRYVIDFIPELNLQQRTAAVIPDRVARALYFNNLGVERLVARSYDEALTYFRNALFLDPELAIAWNNIGALFNRMGEAERAEYSYQRSFDLDASSATSINNLARFYFAHEQFDKADEYNRAIRHFNQRNPYYHYLLGNKAYTEMRFADARDHYRAAIRRNSEEPDFYLAIGQAHLQLGQQEEGMRMLERGVQIMRESDQLTLPSREKLRLLRERRIVSSARGVSDDSVRGPGSAGKRDAESRQTAAL